MKSSVLQKSIRNSVFWGSIFWSLNLLVHQSITKKRTGITWTACLLITGIWAGDLPLNKTNSHAVRWTPALASYCLVQTKAKCSSIRSDILLVFSVLFQMKKERGQNIWQSFFFCLHTAERFEMHCYLSLVNNRCQNSII